MCIKNNRVYGGKLKPKVQIEDHELIGEAAF